MSTAAADLIADAYELVRPVEQGLGIERPLEIDVYLAEEHGGFLASAPPGFRFPSWAAGVALPARAEIYLTLHESSGQVTDLRRVFVHEYAHLALARAAPMADIPRWFQEGFALSAAGEFSFERSGTTGRFIVTLQADLGDLPLLVDVRAL